VTKAGKSRREETKWRGKGSVS